jgi:hypothetical protein
MANGWGAGIYMAYANIHWRTNRLHFFSAWGACFLGASSGILRWCSFGRVVYGLDSYLAHGRQEFGTQDSGRGGMGFGCLEKLSEIK